MPKIPIDNGIFTLFAGKYKEHVALPPPSNSWAANDENEVGVFHISLSSGGEVTLPPLFTSSKCNRSVYFIEGAKASVDGKEFNSKVYLTVDPKKEITLSNPGSDEVTEFLVLEGKAIDEPVVQHGPFVMNTQEEIQQAFKDYQRTQFGGW